MKKISIALLTFVIGIFAFYFFSLQKNQIPKDLVTVQSIDITEEIETEKTKLPEIEKSMAFFDSFGEDEGFGGWFIADDFKAIPEVWTILLSRDYEKSKYDKLIWSAMILTRNADDSPNDEDNFQSVQIKNDGNHLSFKTNKIRGIEYKFEGEFFVKGNQFSEGEKVLKGKLQKFVKGKKVGEVSGDFAYQEPKCFH